MASKSRAYEEQSDTFTVDDTGVVKDWQEETAGKPFETIEIQNVGAHVFLRTGPDSLAAGDVVREEDAAGNHDRRLVNGDIIPDFARRRSTDTKIAFRCATGQSTKITRNPGV